MNTQPPIFDQMRTELSDHRLWQTRAVVLAFGALSGLVVVLFTWLTDKALALFHFLHAQSFWMPLVWTPACTAFIVWITRRYYPGATGSGIPQVMAAVDAQVPSQARGLFVSIKLSVSKLILTAVGLAGGLSLGREGPSVQIAAGVMHASRRWLPARSAVSAHGLLIAGGAAGIAAAFNTPLGGIMFAIEELSRRPEQRSNGLLMAAIILSGLMGMSVFGNSTYFGVIHVQPVSLSLVLPGLWVALWCGVAGGLFARLVTASLSGHGKDVFTRIRNRYPVRFAAGCGLAVAIIGLVSQGDTFGSGYGHTRDLLEHGSEPGKLYVLFKFMTTWITTWSGVPGGIFAPSLAIGAGIGADVAHWTGHFDTPALIAVGMAGFLAAVTQAPMTSFIIVMEMVDGYNLVLTLMAGALVASGVSRLLSAPLYANLAQMQLMRMPGYKPDPSAFKH